MQHINECILLMSLEAVLLNQDLIVLPTKYTHDENDLCGGELMSMRGTGCKQGFLQKQVGNVAAAIAIGFCGGDKKRVVNEHVRIMKTSGLRDMEKKKRQECSFSLFLCPTQQSMGTIYMRLILCGSYHCPMQLLLWYSLDTVIFSVLVYEFNGLSV